MRIVRILKALFLALTEYKSLVFEQNTQLLLHLHLQRGTVFKVTTKCLTLTSGTAVGIPSPTNFL